LICIGTMLQIPLEPKGLEFSNKIKLPTLICLRCGHSWIPRRPVLPKNCPKCFTSYWNTPKCREMGGIGGKTIDLISTNPHYKGKADTIKLPILKCLRCRHEWIPITMYPKYCPICNSPYWNKPKVKYRGQRKQS
jgi:uncharacterized CHY-type Zn-finger protein